MSTRRRGHLWRGNSLPEPALGWEGRAIRLIMSTTAVTALAMAAVTALVLQLLTAYGAILTALGSLK